MFSYDSLKLLDIFWEEFKGISKLDGLARLMELEIVLEREFAEQGYSNSKELASDARLYLTPHGSNPQLN